MSKIVSYACASLSNHICCEIVIFSEILGLIIKKSSFSSWTKFQKIYVEEPFKYQLTVCSSEGAQS